MKDTTGIVPGMTVQGAFGVIRVMAVAERYAMVRYKGCAPFVLSTKDVAIMRDAHADNMKFYEEAGMTKGGTR